jgi:hypothetical protein
MFLLTQAKDLSYSFFFLFIQAYFLFFNKLLLVFGRNVFRLFIGETIAGYLFTIIFGVTLKESPIENIFILQKNIERTRLYFYDIKGIFDMSTKYNSLLLLGMCNRGYDRKERKY